MCVEVFWTGNSLSLPLSLSEGEHVYVCVRSVCVWEKGERNTQLVPQAL